MAETATRGCSLGNSGWRRFHVLLALPGGLKMMRRSLYYAGVCALTAACGVTIANCGAKEPVLDMTSPTAYVASAGGGDVVTVNRFFDAGMHVDSRDTAGDSALGA